MLATLAIYILASYAETAAHVLLATQAASHDLVLYDLVDHALLQAPGTCLEVVPYHLTLPLSLYVSLGS